MTIRSVGLIPCRLKSTRLKNKLLKKIYKYPLFAHTYFKSVNSNLDEVYICTGDDEIIDWCIKLNIKYIKTMNEHSNGTERCAEAGERLKLRLKDRIVNIQGDEPLIEKSNLNLLLSNFQKNKNADVITLHRNIESRNDLNTTKLVMNSKNKVLYISRTDIPFSNKNLNRSIHIGIFCFEFKTLLRITGFKKSFLEQNENIELIRCLENDINVFSYDVKNELIGVDTMKEFKKVKFILENNKKYLSQINKFYSLT